MGREFSRVEVLSRLDSATETGAPVIAAGPANGIAAKCAALGGADLIVSSTLGLSRSMGFPTRAVGDFHGGRSMAILTTFYEVVEDTPIVAGLDANDIFSLDHGRLVDRFAAAGASGIGNIPSSQMFGDDFRAGAGATPRHGMHQEAKLIAIAHDVGLFTVGLAHRADDALLLVDSGADLIIATAGHTSGGSAGYPEQAFDEAVARVSMVIDAVKERDASIRCLGHGGPFNSPESTAVLYERTAADGFYGSSAFDRIPIERGIIAIVEDYKSPLPESRAS